MKAKNARQGSILIEALLSVVIVSVSLTVIIQSMTSSLRSTVYNGEYSRALFLMEHKIFDLMRRSVVDSNFQSEGSFEAPFEQYRYRLKAGQLNGDLADVEVSILWDRGKRHNQIKIDTLALNKSDE